MIQQLISTDVTEFNKNTLLKLKPYFDLNIVTATLAERTQWMENLYTLAKHSLGIAHCIQHNHTGRLLVDAAFDNKEPPEFYKKNYEDIIGSHCGHKSVDTIKFTNNTTVSGTKHWISLIDQADFGVLRVINESNKKLHVLFDFNSMDHVIDMSAFTPIGMEIAGPGSITVDNLSIPLEYILGEQGTQETFLHSSFHDYCFTTNYLGCSIALFEDISDYAEKNNCGVELALNKIELGLSSLKMLWQDNLYSLGVEQSSDLFWNRRNTQYVQSKRILIDLISLILELGVSYYLDAKSPYSQRFRDALMLSSHMQPLYQNAQNLHFLKL